MASTVSLIQMLASGCLTSAGLPIASGKARFYLPGTLTPVSVYSDSAGTTAITPPLTLTAGGTGIAYTKVPTRLILKDSTETTTYFDGLVNIARAEQLEIQSASVNGGTETTLQTLLDGIGTSFGGVAGLWQFKAGVGGTERNYVSVVNDFGISPKSFGAVGDGVVDDTTAIQNTSTFIASLGGGNLVLPPGTFKVSSEVTLGAGVSVVGAGGTASIVNNTSGTGNVFRTTAASTYAFRNFGITHSTSSTGTGIDAGTGSVALFDGVVITGHAIGIISNAGFTSLLSCRLTTSAASTSGALTVSKASTLATVVIGGQYNSTVGSGINVSGTSAVLRVFGAYLNVGVGGTAGIDLTATGSSLFAFGANQVGAAVGLRTATDSGTVNWYGCDWGSAGANDRRTGAPVAYTFAGANNMTPLPLQAKVIRVAQGTGGVVTTINNITAIGFEPFTLICSNTSGGASTFTFGANYALSAAVTPAAGNRVALYLYFDPISGKTYESGRAATAN